MLKHEDIICVSSIDWDFNWQAHQEIMSILADNDNRVLFIENTGVRTPGLRDLPRLKKRVINWRKGLYGIRKERENIYIYSPILLPFPYSRIARYLNRFLFLKALKKWLKASNFNNPIIWTFIPNTITMDLIQRLDSKLVIYYCLDNFSVLTDKPKMLKKIESKLIKESDIVFTTSESLTDKCRQINNNCYTFPVGIPKSLIEGLKNVRLKLPEDMNLKKPIIGYVGGIHKWVDLELIKKIARTKPEWSLVFVGPVQCDVSRLQGIPNIFFLGEKKHTLLPQYINFFDVCIIPYNITEFSNIAYPTKLMLYFSMGKPVVAYATAELKKFKNLVRLIDNSADFISYIDMALNEDDNNIALERMRVANENIWDDKMKKMSHLINEKIEEKRLDKGEQWKKRIRLFYYSVRKRTVLFTLSCLLAYFLILNTDLVWFLAEPLKINNPPKKDDAIVVFAGGVGESGRAGQGYEERVQYAVDLYKKGYAKNIIFSSGFSYVFKEPLLMKVLAISLGMPQEAIILEDKATNTFENVKLSRNIIEKNGWKEILLVSSPYHMRRVSLVFNKIAKNIKVTYVPIPNSLFYSHPDKDMYGRRIWKRISLQQIKGVIHEYLGILYYWLKGWA